MPGPLLASVDTVWVIVLFAFYVVPTLIALARWTMLLVMVFALNLFLGWTIVGWAVSMALAMLLPPCTSRGRRGGSWPGSRALRGSVRFSATDSSQQAAARLALARLG